MVLKMENVFGDYAKYYDILYKDKDYEKECDFLEEIFVKYGKYITNIIDAGCGTGRHTISLAEREYNVTGFDTSKVMIERAREKIDYLNTNIDFQVMNFTNFQYNKKFDACICMFAAIDYITETKDMLTFLKNVRNHLKENSLFIFDFWNGLAVLRTLPSFRMKIVEDKGIKVIRMVEPELDAFNHISKSHYTMLILKNNKLIDAMEETHKIRFYFPQEIKHYLEEAGFEVLKICPFMDLNGKVDENVWNIIIIAKTIGEKE